MHDNIIHINPWTDLFVLMFCFVMPLQGNYYQARFFIILPSGGRKYCAVLLLLGNETSVFLLPIATVGHFSSTYNLVCHQMAIYYRISPTYNIVCHQMAVCQN